MGVKTKNLESAVEDSKRRLKEAERMATIGQVAGMVGHDIRNPLQAIISDLYLLKSDLSSQPRCDLTESMKESFQSVEENLMYISKIVADLQDYARPLSPEYQDVNLSKLIISVFEVVHVPNNITLSIDVQNIPTIKTDLTFVRRALTNLVNNAIQAMPNGGNLQILGLEKEGRLYLTVSDTGFGIPEEVKPKMFTPLMTTKSKGQGLGLAVVKRLIEALHGTITFESEVGKGTKFTIEMPTSPN